MTLGDVELIRGGEYKRASGSSVFVDVRSVYIRNLLVDGHFFLFELLSMTTVVFIADTRSYAYRGEILDDEAATRAMLVGIYDVISATGEDPWKVQPRSLHPNGGIKYIRCTATELLMHLGLFPPRPPELTAREVEILYEDLFFDQNVQVFRLANRVASTNGYVLSNPVPAEEYFRDEIAYQDPKTYVTKMALARWIACDGGHEDKTEWKNLYNRHSKDALVALYGHPLPAPAPAPVPAPGPIVPAARGRGIVRGGRAAGGRGGGAGVARGGHGGRGRRARGRG